MIVFASFYYILFCHLLEAFSLLVRDRKKVDPEGSEGREGLGGVEGGETVTRIYCM